MNTPRPSKAKNPLWIENFRRSWSRLAPKDPSRVPPEKAQHALLKGTQFLSRAQMGPRPPESLPGQPFDAHLLAASSLFRASRRHFLKQGGTFEASLLSSPRTLTSEGLLGQHLEYSPIEKEWLWLATDKVEAKKPEQLLTLRGYSTSLYHEQNHRLLWALLPPPTATRAQLRMYLNLCEAFVVTLDAALGDELGPGFSEFFYLLGTTYDPGTSVRQSLSPREYRNYLQALMHASYLNLEGYGAEGIRRLLPALFPSLETFARRAADRALSLDRLFVDFTNPEWQRRHARKVLERRILPPGNPKPIVLGEKPADNRVAYLLFERWLDLFGL